MAVRMVDTQESAGGISRRRLLVRAGAGAAATAAASALGLAAPASTAFAAPAGQLATGTLRLNAGSEPDTIDPQKASFVGEIDKIMRVFRNLLTFDSNQNLIPDQATDLPQITEDGTRLTFTIRDGLKFSDGSPLTAHDFEYGWKRHMNPKVAGEYAFTGYIIVGAEDYNTADPGKVTADQLTALRNNLGVQALDDKTITFKLKAPAPWFLSVLATWNGLPSKQAAVEAGNNGTEEDSNWTEPATYIGNGPYVLTTWEHQNRMHMKANPLFSSSFGSGAPPIAEVDYVMISEPAVSFAAYNNDELDIAGVQREDKPQVDGDPNLSAQFHQYSGSCNFYLGFNCANAPFDNVNVRQAFAYVIDRTDCVRNILGGQGIPARQFIPQGFPGYYESELEEQVFKPELGPQKLTQAGFPGGKGLPPIKFTFSANARNQARNEALAAYFKKYLGVDITLDPVEARAYTALVKNNATTPQLFFLGWCQDYPDPQDWYSTVFNSKSTVTHINWKNPDFDRLTDQADVQQDPGIRRELYRQAAQILINDAPVAFIYNSVSWVLVKPRLQGFKEDALEYFTGEHNLYGFSLTS